MYPEAGEYSQIDDSSMQIASDHIYLLQWVAAFTLTPVDVANACLYSFIHDV